MNKWGKKEKKKKKNFQEVDRKHLTGWDWTRGDRERRMGTILSRTPYGVARGENGRVPRYTNAHTRTVHAHTGKERRAMHTKQNSSWDSRIFLPPHWTFIHVTVLLCEVSTKPISLKSVHYRKIQNRNRIENKTKHDRISTNTKLFLCSILFPLFRSNFKAFVIFREEPFPHIPTALVHKEAALALAQNKP